MADPTYADILLDNIPVQPEDQRSWGTRMWDFLSQGGPWGTAQPGQRGAWVPSQINAQAILAGLANAPDRDRRRSPGGVAEQLSEVPNGENVALPSRATAEGDEPAMNAPRGDEQQKKDYWRRVDRVRENMRLARGVFEQSGEKQYYDEDLPLYQEAAYGTPFDPYLNGDAARGPISPPLTGRSRMGDSYTTPIPATDETRQAYARLFAHSLRNPITALGASDPSRIGLADGPVNWAWMGGKVSGYYAPHMDLGEADISRRLGGTLAHEFTHRGLHGLRVPSNDVGQLHHRVMGAQNLDSDPGGLFQPLGRYETDDEARALYRELVQKAQEAIAARQRYGGPR